MKVDVSTRRRAALMACLPLVIPAAMCGCVKLVGIETRHITPMDEHNAPMTKTGQGGGKLTCHPTLRGTTQTFRYDPLMWHFGRLPSIKSADGFSVMLDTGLPEMARVTLDVAAQKGWPTHLGKTANVAYVPKVRLGKVTAADLVVEVINSSYRVCLLGLPLYQARGMVLGTTCLAQASYLSFDNGRQKVTIGFEPFEPSTGRKWESYALIGDGSHAAPAHLPWPPMALPWVQLPIAGKPVKVVADSAGGPRLILNPSQWQQMAPALKICRHHVDQYPTWGGFQGVDSHVVDELRIGSMRLKNEVVWVRRSEKREMPPIMGLGLFRSGVVVWDFRHKRFWLGQ